MCHGVSFPELCNVSNPCYCKMSALVVSAGWVIEHVCNQKGACISSPWLFVSLNFPKPARYGVRGW